MEKAQDEINNIRDDMAFAFLLLLKLRKFLVSERRGILLCVLLIILFHGNTPFSAVSGRAASRSSSGMFLPQIILYLQPYFSKHYMKDKRNGFNEKDISC